MPAAATASPIHARSPVCAPEDLKVSFGTTGLDASHVNAYLVFTNTSSATCTLSGYPTVRYVTRGGATIGNPSSPAPAAHGTVALARDDTAHALLRTSVPGVWPPTRCKAVKAFGIRVFPPGSTHSRLLHFPGSVCSGTTIDESTSAPVRNGRGPVPAACTAQGLATTLGPTDGAAGTIYVPLVFTDPVLYTCTLRGHPTVTSVTGPAHTRVGPSASRDPGPSRAVWVQPFGGKASALLGVVETGNFSAGACRPKQASGLMVIAPHTSQGAVLAYRHLVCTRLSSTHVSVVVAGPAG